MRTTLIALLIWLTAGCAGMADSMDQAAGLGVVSESVSTFDNSKSIKVSPTWVYKNATDWTPAPIKMGAQWVNSAPEWIGLIIQYSGSAGASLQTGAPAYINISAIELNIDGNKSSFSAVGSTQFTNSGLVGPGREIYTASENTIVIPMATFEAMLAATDCRIRVHTSSGMVEANFSVARGASGGTSASGAMKPFLAKVKTAKAG